MNDSTKSSLAGLLVLRFPGNLSQEQMESLTHAITPTADALGVEPMVLGNGADVRLEMRSSDVLERICAALERLVAQGEPPELGEQPEPQTLNARPTGLNSRG